MASLSKSSNTRGSITFLHIALKNIRKRIRIPLTEGGKMTQIATGNSCSMSTPIMGL